MEALRKFLFPISLMYALVVHVRNFLYDVDVFKSKAFATPTICIGNLSVGGTGKTPMAEFLISLLKDEYKVALLSRGYRRESKGFVLANTKSTIGDLGDEPYQIFSKFPEIAVAVDADRRNGIRILDQKVSPDVILLDDAFQHRKVNYGFSLLLTAHDNLYVNDWYLPTGSLRDSKREAKRADMIIVTKCPPNLDDSERQRIIQKLKPEPHQQILFSCLAYSSEFIGDTKGFAVDYFRDKKLTLVTGIANPEPLVAYLKEAGLAFEHLRFEDHHSFTENELQQFRTREYLLTTEKDYVRLGGKVENVYYLPIRHRLLDEGRKVLEACIVSFMKSNS
ncbi:tetraacyldisaccharide 4'-kinase [Pricia sp.]|uniref:tetraacyldisaccharide 4'-kinase n=1 Tax=Pricia sp. TaxID=2268138 RepID=UPI003593B193